jgi:hypothetical protein
MPQEVFATKTYAQVLAIQQLEEETSTGTTTAKATKTINTSLFNNYETQVIANSKAGYDIKKRPWMYYFTWANIFKSWLNIGFVPFARQALKHKKVCHVPGKGGTSDEIRRTMEETQKKCVTPKAAAGEEGINYFLFSSILPVHKNHPLVKTNDE